MVAQAWLLATLLHGFIIEGTTPEQSIPLFIALLLVTLTNAALAYGREVASFKAGSAFPSPTAPAATDVLGASDVGVSSKTNVILDDAANGVDRFEANQFIVCTTLKRGIDGTW